MIDDFKQDAELFTYLKKHGTKYFRENTRGGPNNRARTSTFKRFNLEAEASRLYRMVLPALQR